VAILDQIAAAMLARRRIGMNSVRGLRRRGGNSMERGKIRRGAVPKTETRIRYLFDEYKYED
jgi:hypothetical protein